MANQEHLNILKEGRAAWNKWRKENPDIEPDLSSSDLRDWDFGGVNLQQANLERANLSNANLGGVDFSAANFEEANLSRSVLRGARFTATNFKGADLSHINLWDTQFGSPDVGYANFQDANLSNALLGGSDFGYANLEGTNLSGADLGGVDLGNANLNNTDFTGATMGATALGDRDLRVLKGLETVQHRGRSPLSINTIYLSEGDIPEGFLQGVGVPNSFIEYMRSLVGKSIDFYSCFISYSSKDEAFAKRLYADLQSKGVRCWFAPEDMKIGDKIRPHIDEAIRIHDKLLLILSEHSVESSWVEKEVETAFEKERQQNKKTVLFPICLDNCVMLTDQAWAADIRRTRHIGNFCGWKSHDDYQKAFNRLLHDLKAEP